MEKMKWFGLSWGAPVNESCEKVATPVGEECGRCGVAIKPSDRGFVMMHISEASYEWKPWHFACQMEEVLGPDWADQIFWQSNVCRQALKQPKPE